MQSYEYSILDNDAYSAEEFEVFSTSMNYIDLIYIKNENI
ncbi:19054_t:CDS:2 [Rhizophagus irregularis]|nr:19054_t:CDS:2 [Rhizophagus irregularis]